MKSGPLQIVSTLVALLMSVTIAESEDAAPCGDESSKSGHALLPGICPLWPIDQIGNEYLYYSEYHDNGDQCDPEMSAAYLQGNYQWPIDCATQPHLCEGTGGADSLRSLANHMGRPFPGHTKSDAQTLDPVNLIMPDGHARMNASFDTTKDRLIVSFKPPGDSVRKAALFRVQVTTKEKPLRPTTRTLYYGFEVTEGTVVGSLRDEEYLDKYAQGSTTENSDPTNDRRNDKVIRGTFGFDQKVIIFRKQNP